MPMVTATEIPSLSLLSQASENADFKDAYSAKLSHAALSPTEIFLAASRAVPRWAEALMAIRNRMVRLVGLKDVGALRVPLQKAPQDYSVGDQLGIFLVFAKTEDEIVLGIDDKHLDVRVSILKSPKDAAPGYTVSTIVNVRNWLGKLYMLPVSRIHPLIVRAMMGRAAV